MKESDNSTRKIHISSNFILPINLLIMLETLFRRPSLHCSTPLHFTTLHPTTLHYTSLRFTTLHYNYRHFTSSHLHFTTLLFSFAHLHFISFSIYTNLKDGGRANMDAVLQNAFVNLFNGMFWCGELTPELGRSILDAPCIAKYSNSSC
jgi:hypothetical protein